MSAVRPIPPGFAPPGFAAAGPYAGAESPRSDGDPLVIGFVNNMPDAEFRATEQQFARLLAAASLPGREVRLRLLALPEIPRAAAAAADIRERYEDVGDLEGDTLDSLIVSGTEPRAPALTTEPYWPALARLIDWAEDHTSSTIWSCLAAHAAVLHLDGIERQKFPAKLSGVFECARMGEHEIVDGMPSQWAIPHSRHNGLSEAALTARGYRILSGSPDTGPDMFVRPGRSLFLFLQGHPEYDRESLLREHRRDIGRFLAGRREHYPEAPGGYFDRHANERLAAFRQRAMRDRRPELLLDFPVASDGGLAQCWREPALQLYGGWLRTLLARREDRRGASADRPRVLSEAH